MINFRKNWEFTLSFEKIWGVIRRSISNEDQTIVEKCAGGLGSFDKGRNLDS